MQEQFVKERLYFKGVSPKTVIWYNIAFKAFTGALDSKASILQRIEELRTRGVSAITVNSYLRVINAYFRWKHEERGEPKLRIPKLKEEQKILQTLSGEDVKRLVNFRPKGENLTRAHLVAITITDTGLRISETLGLTKEDVDFDSLILKVLGKGGKHRLVPFSVELRKTLFRHVSNMSGRYIFGTKNNTKLTVRNLNRDFKVLADRCGIKGIRFSPHTLRHSCAVNWIRRGGDLYMLQRVLGHSSIQTTTIYLRSLGVNDISPVHARLTLLSANGG